MGAAGGAGGLGGRRPDLVRRRTPLGPPGASLAAVDRARGLFLAHRLWALVIGKFFFEVNAAVAALAGTSGIGVVDSSSTRSEALWSGGRLGGLGCVLQGVCRMYGHAGAVGMELIIETAVALAAYGAVKYARRGQSSRSRRAHESAHAGRQTVSRAPEMWS